jgi:phage tail-like protein
MDIREISPPKTRINFGFKYLFEVRGSAISGGFAKISGLKQEFSVEEKRAGGDPTMPRLIPGPRKGGRLVLERGICYGGTELTKWFKSVAHDSGYRATIRVWSGGFLEEEGAIKANPPVVIMGAEFQRAWPCAYELGDLDSKASEIEIERLTIAYDLMIPISSDDAQKSAQMVEAVKARFSGFVSSTKNVFGR